MSRSRKDGRRKGGHAQKQRTGYEYWSARAPSVAGADQPGRKGKRLTHRAERRQAKEITNAQLVALRSQ